ncbi:MAG: hotdog fold thioesterase [Prevotellaceae bacterium]|nr:hotdog fold thioesterase [Prevotellaceae bacterium]MDO4992675.1 hotdog fold thioesterase [Prevotellaceae bacterium]
MNLLERLNTSDRFANGIGAQLVEIREGYARAELTVEEKHLNGANVCQGGVMYTLADLAFAGVCNCHGTLTLGVNNSITFLKSGQLGEKIIAEAVEVLDHHKLPYCEIKVRNEQGELLAVMTGLGYRLKKDFEFDSLM